MLRDLRGSLGGYGRGREIEESGLRFGPFWPVRWSPILQSVVEVSKFAVYVISDLESLYP